MPIDLLHEGRDDEVRFRMLICRHELAPRYDADDREVDPDVDDRDGDGADQNRTRDHPTRFPYFVADIADIVIAQVIVDTDSRRRAESEEEAEREVEGAGRK